MINRTIIQCIIVVAILFPVLTFSSETHDGKIKQLAAVKATQQAISKLRNFQAETLTGTFKDIMLHDPGKYRQRTSSRELLEDWYVQEQKKYVQEEKQRIFDEFGEEGKAFSYEWLSGYIEQNSNITTSIDEIIRENQRVIFQQAFDMAREQAVYEQWEQINIDIYPEPSEVETLSKKGHPYVKSIMERLEQDMSGKLNVFEENSSSLDTAIQKVLEDAIYQFNSQLDVLKKSRGGEHLTQKAISRKIREEIDVFISNLETRQGRYIYRLFPSIENVISIRSNQLVKDKLTEYVNSPEVAALVHTHTIKSIILDDPTAHKNLIDSTIIVHSMLLNEFTENVIRNYVQKAEQADGNVPGFQSRIREFLAGKKDETDVLSDRLLSIIAEVSPPLREEIAQEQLSEYFSEIYNRQWEIPEQVIVEYYLTENEITNNERYRPRHSIDIDELPTWLQISNFDERKSLLLDEAVDTLRALLKDDLLNEGYLALSKQITIIDSHREDMRGKIRGSIDQGREKDIVPHLFKIYQYDVQSKWSKERLEFKPSLGDKYAGLFRYSEDLIRSLLTFDMKEVKTEIAREKESQPPAKSESQDKRVESPSSKKSPEVARKKEDSSGSCEEQIDECQKELEYLKGILKELRKGMI